MVGNYSIMALVELTLRWLHLFFGVLWIGHLYYFNFTQGTFLNDAEVDAGAKTWARRRLLPVALYYFRWGAMWTLVTGVIYYGLLGHLEGGFGNFLASSHGWAISIGALFGITMWYNVWFVIWPMQKIVIANAEGTAKGQPTNPAAAGAGARANVASRTNTLLSIPVLFFMTTARLLSIPTNNNPNYMVFWIVFAVLLAAIEFNALKGQTYKIMTTVRQVVHSGFGLTLVLLGLIWASVSLF